MKHILFPLMTVMIFASCSQNGNEHVLEDQIVSITNEGLGKELMELVFEITDEGNRYCYEDTLFSQAYTQSIFEHENHITKEVIQLPDPEFAGEFMDSVIEVKATRSSFRKMLIFGNFKEGALQEVLKVQLLFNIIIQGMDLGDIASVNIDPRAFDSESGFIQKTNKIIANESLPVRSRHAFEKQRNTGNMGGMGGPE